MCVPCGRGEGRAGKPRLHLSENQQLCAKLQGHGIGAHTEIPAIQETEAEDGFGLSSRLSQVTSETPLMVGEKEGGRRERERELHYTEAKV